MTRRKSDAFWSFVGRHAAAIAALLLCTAGALVYLHMRTLTAELIEQKTLIDARFFAEAIAEFRTLYTSEVVQRVHSHGVEVTHDYRERDGAIPLPATLGLLLGERLAKYQDGAHTRLYSPYPFPWRQDSGGLRDPFATEAWSHLQRTPEGEYSRMEDTAAGRTLRLAIADRMRESCVQCHNTHPDSPKRDWQTGDVRGVLEVSIPIHRIEATTRASLRGTLVLMIALALAGAGAVGLVIRRLRRTMDDLGRSIQGLERREGEIRRINEDLTSARDAALAGSRAKSQFLATMSHELRTPLNAILGYSEMLLEEAEEKGHPGYRADLDRIHAAGTNLLGIVANVLEFSRLESGHAALELEGFDVPAFVRELAAGVESEVRKGGNVLETRCPPDLGSMITDRAKLRQALRHVLGNAAKFTEKGRIELDVARETVAGRDGVRFRVTDTGVGIDVAQQKRLFQPFMQADESTTRRYGGVGLGLAVTRSLCESMQGEVGLTSVPKQGTVVTLRIPSQPAAEEGGAGGAASPPAEAAGAQGAAGGGATGTGGAVGGGDGDPTADRTPRPRKP